MKHLLKHLWSHLSSRRRLQFCLVSVLMFFASFAEIMSVGAVIPFLGVIADPSLVYENPVMQPIIRLFDVTEPNELILPITLVFIGAAILAGSIRLLLLYATTRLSYGAGHDLSADLYRRTLYQSYSVHVARNSSEVINGIITKTSTVISGVLTPVLTLISSIIIMTGILGLLSYINLVIAIIAFGSFGTLYMGVIYYTRARIRTNSQIIAQQTTTVVKSLQEGLMGIRDVLIHDSQELYSRMYRKADLPFRRASGNNLFISGSPRFAMESIGMSLIAVMAYLMTQQDNQLTNSLPMLGALALGAQRLLPIMQQAFGSYSAIKGSRSSLEDVIRLLNQSIPSHAGQPLPKRIPFNRKISLENVSFRYLQEGPWILNSINLEIKKGSRVGIIGATGSGKSTLFDLIVGLFTPSEGQLRVDDEIINEQNIRSWRARIAHVPQDIYLSDTSILENIAFGVPPDQIDFERVKMAAQGAQADDLIESWDMKYKMVWG